MRQNTIITVRNTPINYSTADFITSELIEVCIDNSMLHQPFDGGDIAFYIKHIKMR